VTKHRVNTAVSRDEPSIPSSLAAATASSLMSAKLRDEIEAKRLKLQELRQARLARQRQDTERRASVGPCRIQSHIPLGYLTLFRLL
jgi:hypothetical protein